MDAARLAAVEDRLALLDLEGAYARTFDSRDGDAWAALFTEDGIYQARGAAPGERGHYAGRAALADFCTNAPFDGLHLLHPPELVIEGDDATARVHLVFMGTFHGKEAAPIETAGYYDVRYARIDGHWHIRHRVTTTLRNAGGPVGPYPRGTAFDEM